MERFPGPPMRVITSFACCRRGNSWGKLYGNTNRSALFPSEEGHRIAKREGLGTSFGSPESLTPQQRYPKHPSLKWSEVVGAGSLEVRRSADDSKFGDFGKSRNDRFLELIATMVRG
jgi:hypothetical protein